jgi:hypothetical protein
MMAISKGWIEWKGGKRPPFPVGTKIQVNFRGGNLVEGYPDEFRWSYSAVHDPDMDIIAYRIAESAEPTQAEEPKAHGGKLSGDHYYRVTVSNPIAPDVQPYVAECADIIEALNMTFNEGEAFKAIWRLAAGRLGRVKPGSAGMQYDADKVAHYGVRVAEHTRLRG